MARAQETRSGFRRASGRGAWGLVFTLALHGGVLAAVAIASGRPEPPLVVSRDFVLAEMVKLGKPRDKFWLPRIQQPPHSTAPPDSIKVADDPNAKAAPKEAPRPEDPTISKDLKRALDRARKLEALATPDEPEEGSETGSKLGTSNRQIGDAYQAEVVGLLHQNYNFPAGVDVGNLSNPPEISFHIGTDGAIADVKLTKPSGNSFVDDACVDAAKLTAKLPPPPAGVRGMRVQCEK